MNLLKKTYCFFLGIDYQESVRFDKKLADRKVCNCYLSNNTCSYKINVSDNGQMYLTGQYRCGRFLNKIRGLDKPAK